MLAEHPALATAPGETSCGLLDAAAFNSLLRNPEGAVSGAHRGVPFRARVIVPGNRARIDRHYRDIVPALSSNRHAPSDMPRAFEQFGLQLCFERPAEIAVHDRNMMLDPSIRALVATFGPVILRNAVVGGDARQRYHRNIFPHLRFHTDRGPTMPNRYSCFARDPADAAQRAPRDSSTLFVATVVAWLEGVRDGQIDPAVNRGAPMALDLFAGGDGVAGLLGDIILEQPWSEPDGTGEITVIDNATVLHATYHKIERIKGYPIGARYLS